MPHDDRACGALLFVPLEGAFVVLLSEPGFRLRALFPPNLRFRIAAALDRRHLGVGSACNENRQGKEKRALREPRK